MSYSIFRSKTFWVLVFTFAFNGFAAISASVPSTWAIIINAVLTGVASTFHLDTAVKAGAVN